MADGTAHIDVQALTKWMDDNGVPGTGELPDLGTLSGGSQNELTVISRGGQRMVMRKPPSDAAPDRVDGIRREHRLVKALKGADVPHAQYIAGTDDADLLGMPFYIMEAVDGWSPADQMGWAEPFASDPSLRPGLASELVRGAALLGNVDWRARGLEGFGRPDNFHERQVDRWMGFWERIKCRELPGITEAAAWLRNHQPRHWSPGIMHGDYQFANVMYRHGAPARLAAIIDWEMTTIGDPLLDLGWVLVSWPSEDEGTDGASNYVDLRGMPSIEEVAALYEKFSGRSVADLTYYIVLARWKLGIVLEQGYSRFMSGAIKNDKLAAFGPIVPDLIARAAALAQRNP